MVFDLLVFETLNLKAMHRLWGRKVGDLGFADFLLKTQWMAKKLGRDVVKIDRWEPTTQTCHLCGHAHKTCRSMCGPLSAGVAGILSAAMSTRHVTF